MTWALKVNLIRFEAHHSNPRPVLPSVRWVPSVFRLNSGEVFSAGALSLAWLWFDLRFWFEHTERAALAREEHRAAVQTLRGLP